MAQVDHPPVHGAQAQLCRELLAGSQHASSPAKPKYRNGNPDGWKHGNFEKTLKYGEKVFDALTRRFFFFFQRIHAEVQRKSVMERLSSHLRVSGCDVRGHVTSSLEVKMA